MAAGAFRLPSTNPIRSYAPGSPERASTKPRLKQMAATKWSFRCSSAERKSRLAAADGRDAARPSTCARRIPKGVGIARHCRRSTRRAPHSRMDQLVVRRSRRRHSESRRTPEDDVARHDQRRDHARPVEDDFPGGNRCGLRDRRFLAIQRPLRTGTARRTAVQRPHDVESARVPRARRDSFTR